MARILVLLVAAGFWALTGGCATSPAEQVKQTYSSFDRPSDHGQPDKLAAGSINFQNLDVTIVLKVYAALSGRTVITGQIPMASITVFNQAPLSRTEALQLLDTALAQNGIAMVLSGDKSVKAVPEAQATMESPPEITLPWQFLPDSSSCMIRTVQVHNFKPSEVVPVLVPLSRLPNSIMPIDGKQLLLLRDYSANIRQELRLLEELETKTSPLNQDSSARQVQSPAPVHSSATPATNRAARVKSN